MKGIVMKNKISDIEIELSGPLRRSLAYVDFTYDKTLRFSGFSIYIDFVGPKKLRYPGCTCKNQRLCKYNHHISPIHEKTYDIIEEVIINKYEKLYPELDTLKKVNAFQKERGVFF